MRLEELTELELDFNSVFISIDDLLEIAECAKKLQSLRYFERDHHCNGQQYKWLHIDYEKVKFVNGRKRRSERFAEIKGNYQHARYEYEKFLSAIREGRRLPGVVVEGQRCIDAYMEMVRKIGQRQEKARLLIKLDHDNHIAANIPKDLIRQYNDIVTLVVEDRMDIFEPFCFL